MIKSKQIQRPQLVLVVDDVEINRDVLGMILEKDYEILYAENGQEALSIMKEQKENLSIVLLDLIMPVMNGFEVLECVRNDEQLKKIPIITVHQSKGCEFDTVIIADADDSSYPTYQAQKNNTEEEEKRVFYVAISRAKEKLILVSSATADTGYGVRLNPQSRYIRNIPEACVITRTVR